MSVNGVKPLIDAWDAGQYHMTSFRKVPSAATVAGGWADLSMASGNPVTNFYASSPLVAATLNGRAGLYHGENVSPAKKHLVRLLTQTTTANAVPHTLMLCDYLLYYPFIDGDSTDEQALDNTVTLPRYATGEGVFPILVAQGSYLGSANFSINYTNHEGASKTSVVQTANATTFTSSLLTSGPGAGARGPFVTLDSGDRGVRSVESITFQASVGGIFALVLVKPLYTHVIRAITAPSEADTVQDKLSIPIIEDGAYLNFLILPNASVASAPIFGVAEFAWGDS